MKLSDYLFHEEPGITLYCGDARVILPMLCMNTTYCLEMCSGACLAVMVTDPPYGMKYESGWSGNSVAGDNDTEARDTVLEQWGERPAIVFGRWSVPMPKGVRQVLIWDKGEWPGMGDLSFPWGPSHEEIYVIGDGFTGVRMGTVIRANRITSNAMHPTEKPLAALRPLITRCPNGVIVDPFCGSGSTLEAAKQQGRAAIGIEIEPKYCEIAVKRLRQEVLPL